MNRISRTVARVVTLAGTLALSLLLAAPAAWAAEEGGEKIQLPQSPRDRVGMFLIGATIIGVAIMLWNARKQLRGERKQASGEFRWR